MATQKFKTGISAEFFDDPAHLVLAGAGTDHYFQSPDGIGAAVAPANQGRIRYNDTTKTWQSSVDGGAYVDFTTTFSGPFTLTGNVITPTVSTNRLRMGDWVGTASAIWDFPNQRMILTGESPTGGGTIYTCQHAVDDVGSQCEFAGYRSRGTIAVPTSILSGDHIVRYAAVGYDGATMRYCVSIDFVAESTFSGGAPYKAAVVFKAGGGPTPTEKMRLTNEGHWTSSAIDSGANAGYYITNPLIGVSYGEADATVRTFAFYGAGGTQKAGFNVSVDGAAGYIDVFSSTAGGVDFPWRFTATENIAKMDIRLLNAKNLLSKTTGGTLVNLIGFGGGDVLYIGDGNVPEAWIFTPIVSLGINTSSTINMKSTIRCFGATGGTNGVTGIMIGNGKTIGSKTVAATYVDILYMASDDVLYIGDGNVPTIHVFNNNCKIGIGVGSLLPNTDNQFALGSAAKRFSTLYSVVLNTGDLNMDDEAKGSHWTVREAKEADEDVDLMYFINRRNGKKVGVNFEKLERLLEAA